MTAVCKSDLTNHICRIPAVVIGCNGPVEIYCSDFKRTRETADEVAQVINCKVCVLYAEHIHGLTIPLLYIVTGVWCSGGSLPAACKGRVSEVSVTYCTCLIIVSRAGTTNQAVVLT